MKKRLIIILILPLLMSCQIGNGNIPTSTASPSVSIQPSPSVSQSVSPSSTPTVIPSTPVPTATISVGAGIIDTYDIAIVLGRVYDQDGKLVDRAKVESKFIRPDEIINKDAEYTLDGIFVIRGIPIEPYDEIKGELTVSKEGYKTVTRTVTVISEIKNQRNDKRNTFNFGGTGEEAQYALVKIEQ